MPPEPNGIGSDVPPVPLSAQRPVQLPPPNFPLPVQRIGQPLAPVASHRLFIPIVAVGACLLAVGGVAFAYYEQIGPFAAVQYTEASFMTQILAKAAQIKTATYSGTASLAVNQREAGATVLTLPSVDPVSEAQYEHDAQRISALRDIASSLTNTYGGTRTYDYTTRQFVTKPGKRFPATLSAEQMKALTYTRDGALDPVTKQPYVYKQTEGGKNFSLTATLESDSALAEVRKSYSYIATTTIITDKQVSFTKDSGYLYIPSSLPKPFLAQLADFARRIPVDVSGSVTLGATTDFTQEIPDWSIHFGAQGDLGDLSYAVDVEGLRKGSTYYVRVNKMPSLFGMFSNYKGTWIEIVPKAATTSTTFFRRSFDASDVTSAIAKNEESFKKSRTDMASAARKIAELADKHKLLVFKSKPVREKVNGRTLYRYELTVQKDALIPFYKDLIAEPSFTKQSFVADPELLAYLESKDFDTIFAYLKNNVFVTLWTDGAGFPAIVEYRLRIVPPDSATQLAGKQIDLTFKMVLSSINAGVNIEVPKDTTPLQKVVDDMNGYMSDSLGVARVKSDDAVIRSNLDSVRVQGEIYYDTNNGYGTQSWVVGSSTSCTSGLFKDSMVVSSMGQADTANGTGKVACYAYGTGYIAGADLKSGGWWCVDSKGASKSETGSLASVNKIAACP